MTAPYSEFVRRRRAILGLTQREVAGKAGVKQPLIAAIEAGRREASPASRAALDAALAMRPSTALAARRDQVRELFDRFGLPAPRVFGSVARGDDDESSDIDMLVEFTLDHDIVDLLALEHDLESLLTVSVDIVDARSVGEVSASAHRDLIPL